jgi:hypothetical protein
MVFQISYCCGKHWSVKFLPLNNYFCVVTVVTIVELKPNGDEGGWSHFWCWWFCRQLANQFCWKSWEIRAYIDWFYLDFEQNPDEKTVCFTNCLSSVAVYKVKISQQFLCVTPSCCVKPRLHYTTGLYNQLYNRLYKRLHYTAGLYSQLYNPVGWMYTLYSRLYNRLYNRLQVRQCAVSYSLRHAHKARLHGIGI